MTTLIIIVTVAALWFLLAWDPSDPESNEKRRIAIEQGVVIVFAVIALCIWGLSASASTVQLDPGDAGLVWTAEGFRPVDGIDTHEAKYSCPRAGLSWKDMAADRVMRETRCPVPEDAGIRWVAPLGLGPTPSIWHQSTSYGSPGGGGGFPPGGGGSCGCGGGNTPPNETPEEPPAPIPLPWAGALLLAALGWLGMMRRKKA